MKKLLITLLVVCVNFTAYGQLAYEDYRDSLEFTDRSFSNILELFKECLGI